MKKFIPILLLGISSFCLKAQVFNPPEVLLSQTGGNSFSFNFLAGDLNNDNLPDLVGRGEGSTFKYFFNKGDNTFDEQSFPTGNSFIPISIADFNNDGMPDVLGNNKMIATNQGNNTFDYIFEVSSSPNLDSRRVGVADFNDDGNLDYLSIPSVSFEDELHWHSGNGSFEFTPNPAETSEEHEYASIVDFNNDGLADIISANQFGKGQFKLMLNDGEGNFELYRDLRDVFVSETFRFADMADIDLDGDLEIIGVSQGSGVYYLENLGDDEFSQDPTFVSTFYNANAPLAVLVRDVNNDGYVDIVSYDENFDDYTIFIYINNKNGGFTPEDPLMDIEKYSGLPAVDFQVMRHLVQLIDMDGNGSLDLVINDTKNGQVYVSYNTTIVSSVEEKISGTLEIYPNPTEQYINLPDHISYDEYNIVSMDGSIVKTGKSSNQIDLDDLAVAGQYILILKQEGKPVLSGSFSKR